MRRVTSDALRSHCELTYLHQLMLLTTKAFQTPFWTQVSGLEPHTGCRAIVYQAFYKL